MTGPLPLSLIAHTAFCERRAWLEATGERADSMHIEAGVAAHERVDSRSDERADRHRSVEVAHPELGIRGKCDVVDVNAGGVRVVEFKSAPGRRSSEPTPAQRVQLALQGLCLEFMGNSVESYGIHFTTSRRTVSVDIGEDDRALAVQMVHRTRAVVESDEAPPALVDDPRCGRCSHANVCLPDERRFGVVRPEVRAADPHGSTVHLATSGSRASLRQGRLVVSKDGEQLASVPLERISSVVVHGNVDLSTGLIRELLWRAVPIVWCSARGTAVGYATTTHSPNGHPRHRQHVRSEAGDLELARELIGPKIANQATLLRRSLRERPAALERLRAIQRRAQTAASVSELLGLEGDAARTYFAHWPQMLRAAGAEFAESWVGRAGRGAMDPINVALNVAYGLLLADTKRAVVACGLDPAGGFVHTARRNKPALALDLMEQFRPVVADSAVLTAFNTGALRPKMFVDVSGSTRLSDPGRRVLLAAYERRVGQEFRHPIFHYQVSWRRAIEVQARLILGVIDGTQPDYRGIRVR